MLKLNYPKYFFTKKNGEHKEINKESFTMKNITKLIFVPLFLLILLSHSSAQRREAQPVTFVKISERLYEISGGQGANSGMYIGDDSVLIIDSKMDEKSVDQVIERIKQITDKPIQYLVNTHSDGDHTRGNRYFSETVTIIAHENCRKELLNPNRDGTQSEWTKSELAPFVPSLTFRDKMDIYLGSKKIELRYFGIGHTTGDIVVYIPDEKTAFIGDLIFSGRPQLIHSYKGGNSFEYIKTTTELLETIDAEKFSNGHGEIADRKQILNHISQMKKRQEKVKALIEKKKSLDELKNEFEENESGLIETIYNELKNPAR